jgi:pyruvate dehydrogenase E1 component alpha subunit
MSDPATYRTPEEVVLWKKRDPIPRLKAAIQHDFEMTDEEFNEVDEKVRKLLDEAVEFAEAGAELPVERLYDDLYVESEQ